MFGDSGFGKLNTHISLGYVLGYCVARICVIDITHMTYSENDDERVTTPHYIIS